MTHVVISASAETFGSFDSLSMNSVQVSGSPFSIPTENIVGTPQTASRNCPGLLGMLRKKDSAGTSPLGGCVPR